MYSQAITSVLLVIFWGFVFDAEAYSFNSHNNTMDFDEVLDRILKRVRYRDAPDFYVPSFTPLHPSLSTTTLPPLLNVEKCPDRYGWVLKNDFCYFFSSEEASSVEKKSWRDARKYCVQQGGDLLSMVDSDESLFISQYMRKFKDILLWIGGRAKLEFMGSFDWSDGKPFLFNNWDLNEPNNILGQEDCLSLYPHSGKWNDDNCGRSLNFICKKPKYGNYTSNAAVKPSDQISEAKGYCSNDFSKAGNKCFILITSSKSFKDAREYCRGYVDGELASINSQLEQDVISSMFYDVKIDIDYVWIGMKYMNGFLWLDQSTMDYTNWDKGEPNNNGFVRKPHIWSRGPVSQPGNGASLDHSMMLKNAEECVELFPRNGYRWHDDSCDEERKFICQKPVDSTLGFDQNIEFCKYPYNDFVKKGDGCYKVIDEQKSWKEAEEFCQQLGSNLMSIEFLEENNYIYTSLLSNYTSDDRFWMGMKYNNQTQSFKFSDENPVLFTNWGMDANDSCVVLSVSDNGKWYSEPCSKEHKFICKYSSVKYILEGPDVTGSCPSEQWIDFHGEYCYLFEIEEKADWIKALIRCRREGGNLASIHSKQEENLLRNFMERNHLQLYLWIGLVRIGNSFSWSDGTPMDHQNWVNGESNREGERCTEIDRYSYKWKDSNCDTHRNFVCKIPKLISTDSIPKTEKYLKTVIPTDESSSENIFSQMKYQKQSVKSEHQPRNPTTTIIVCLSSISLLVVVSVMFYYYKRKYRRTGITLRSGTIDDSVHYHGGDDEDQMIPI